MGTGTVCSIVKPFVLKCARLDEVCRGKLGRVMWAAIGRGEGEGTRWLGDEGMASTSAASWPAMSRQHLYKVMLQGSLDLEGFCC
jgi:hypothetical protein